MSVGCLVFPQQDCFLVNQEAKPGAHKGILQTHFKKWHFEKLQGALPGEL